MRNCPGLSVVNLTAAEGVADTDDERFPVATVLSSCGIAEAPMTAIECWTIFLASASSPVAALAAFPREKNEKKRTSAVAIELKLLEHLNIGSREWLVIVLLSVSLLRACSALKHLGELIVGRVRSMGSSSKPKSVITVIYKLRENKMARARSEAVTCLDFLIHVELRISTL
jgi:hypothetical protein